MTFDCPDMSSKQSAAVAVIARGGTVPEAAAAAGVDPRTVVRWRRLATFSAAVRGVVSDALGDAVGVLADAAGDAASYLADVARGREPSDVGRVNAARLVLVIGPSLRESVELESRLSAVEAAIGGQ